MCHHLPDVIIFFTSNDTLLILVTDVILDNFVTPLTPLSVTLHPQVEPFPRTHGPGLMALIEEIKMTTLSHQLYSFCHFIDEICAYILQAYMSVYYYYTTIYSLPYFLQSLMANIHLAIEAYYLYVCQKKLTVQRRVHRKH